MRHSKPSHPFRLRTDHECREAPRSPVRTTVVLHAGADSGPPTISRVKPYPEESQSVGHASLANVWSVSNMLRRDIRHDLGGDGKAAPGLRLELKMNLELAGLSSRPKGGLAVYVWHCDAAGRYSVYDVNGTTSLRGIGVTGSNGRVQFTTIYPGTYRGREPHIHFEVYPTLSSIRIPEKRLLLSRITFPEVISRAVYESHSTYRPSLEHFNALLFGKPEKHDPSSKHSSRIASVSGSARKALRASISVQIGR